MHTVTSDNGKVFGKHESIVIYAVGVKLHDPIKTNENIIVQLKDTSNINVDYGLDPIEGLGDLVRVG